MKSKSLESLENYLVNKPLKVHSLQDYKVMGFSLYYINYYLFNYFLSSTSPIDPTINFNSSTLS